MKKLLHSTILAGLLLAAPVHQVHAVHLVHAVHISYTQATWTESTITGKATYYKDDYDRAVLDWSGKPQLSTEEAAKLRSQYFTNYFRLWLGSFTKQIQASITSIEDDGSSYIFHFSFELPTGSNAVTLDNRIIAKEYRDQTNLLQITVMGRDENYVFTKSDPTISLRK